MTNRAPDDDEIATMAREVLIQQMLDDPAADTVSSGIILPIMGDHGFSHEHEALLEGPVEDIWGRHLKGEIVDPVAAVESIPSSST